MDETDWLSRPQKACFLLGIAPRSGTNFLFSLLKRHPECLAGSFGELRLLRHAELLVTFTERVVASWSQKWVVEGAVDEDMLLRALGAGLVGFLGRQSASTAPGEASASSLPKKVLLTKTPDLRGLQHQRRLFPEARTLLLVRDGRAVVESGVRSFGWNYERAMQQWAAAAAKALDFTRGQFGTDHPFLLVRYEDLVADEKVELERIFSFLGLDPALYDFEEARAMGVIGSSEARDQAGRVHWNEVAKSAAFDPLRRFEGWSRRRRTRFAWVAGSQMEALGYDLDTPVPRNWPSRAWHGILDLNWSIEQSVLGMVRPLVWPLVVAAKRRTRRNLARGRDEC